MLKKASLVVNYHLNNKIFDIQDRSVNRDNYGYSIWLLKDFLKAEGYDLSTCDINTPEDSEVVIYFDIPEHLIINNAAINILCLFENEVIKPRNIPSISFAQFDFVLTWNDDYLIYGNFLKFNYTHKLMRPYDFSLDPSFNERKLCTLISANKMVEHPRELYSERLRAINWFESNAPSDFDLYGVGWDQFPNDGSLRNRLLNKLMPVSRVFMKRHPSYKGTVESKNSTLRNYRFSICFENALGYPGYISEKIFDSLMAGCIPVYYGAPNISDYIPKGCYINFSSSLSYEELYIRIKNISESEFLEYQKEIKSFLNSDNSDQFGAAMFSEIIIKCIRDYHDHR